jgi:zinc protease
MVLRFYRALAAAALSAAVLIAAPVEAQAMKIQEVVTKSGIKAWLVEERAVPLVAMRFAFEGGSSQDPVGKEGLAHFLTGMFDEGAGELDANAFQKRAEEIAMRMSFEDGKDSFFGSFETLTENRAAAVALLKSAINQPRFDPAPIERIRSQLLSSLAFAARDPNRVASERWFKAAFPDHPYGRPSNGTEASLKAITRDDLIEYRRRIFARDTLRVVMVGDIGLAEATALLDDVFGSLPAKADLRPVPPATMAMKAAVTVVDLPIPQSVAMFGSTAVARKDKDFMPAFVLNHLLGGGGFSSRLMEQVREKRGLAYSVYSYIQPYSRTSLFLGGVATKNEEMAQSLDVIKAQLSDLATNGPTQTEVDNAKSFLIGSFPLRFDTNSKIANQLLYFLQEDFGIDYLDRRNAEVAAVTLDEVKRVAKRLFESGDLFITVVGQPKGLPTKG